MPRLFLKRGRGQGIYYELRPGSTTIGRSRGCTIELRSIGVSRNHASIRIGPGGEAVLEDAGSKNGTLVNGKHVERVALRDGDEVAIGQTLFVFSDERSAREKEPAPVEPSEQAVCSQVRSVLNVDDVKKIDSEAVIGDIDLLKKTHKYLSILCKVSRTVSATLNLSEILNAITEIIFEVINPDEAFIMLKDDVTEELKLRVFRSKGSSGKQGTIAVSHTILDKVLKEGVAVLSADASADSRFKSADSVLRYRMMSTMCVPLVSKGEVLGVLNVANRSASGEFQEEDLQLLSGIANQAALAIENSKLYHNIQLEVQRRNNLQRYLSPNEVDQIIDGTREINLGGEIKEVTVLFSDIRGFTKLSEELPPNEVVGMLNEYFSEMTRIVFKNGGTVDKFIGDALIVVFGSAIPHPDDPLRAVKTAIEMQAAMKEINAQWKKQKRKTFQIGIGVNTGEVLYGNVGSEQRMELTVIGDAVNLAARLADVAAGGEVLLSGTSWEAAGGRVSGEKMLPLQIKGKKDAVEVYRVKLE
jgi:adenylate cyclase